ncbi:MAG TPA: SPFH domain-containing protein [Thermoanaerobaculia bacterium]|nr:SPFH domain-containing protein [Thermoanaerobaculia bacterium]
MSRLMNPTAIRISRRLALAALLLPLALGGCLPSHTGATEVGVRFNKLTGSYSEYPPGATYFFVPVVGDWQVFDISLRNLAMTADVPSGDRAGKDDLRFKTRDGNDIETDVTVRWRVDPTKAAYIWKFVASSTDDVEERLVRPQARTYVRDVLNRLDSEEFYNPTKRFAAAADATLLLSRHLQPYGVVVEQVLLGDFQFKAEYQALINKRKEAEKQAEKLEAEIKATAQLNQANLQNKIAELTEKLTRADGEFQQAQKASDAYLVQREQAATATLAEKKATAEGIRRERDALNGSAGDAYVSLQLIEALQKKELRQIPKLPGGNTIIDGNRLLEQLGVIRYNQRSQEAAEAAEPPQ